ncbi:MAG: xanthine phosphoribosyltransferase [Rhodobacteraceae bacterium]|nr:xanthine phosphoribosyltransferase [Paracoccaceae bacterium]
MTGKDFNVTWEELHRDVRALAWRLDTETPEQGAWKGILAVTRGGMAPAMIIARELNIRAVDTISVKCYMHQDQHEPTILKNANRDFVGDGENILVVDDLVDTGRTLELVRGLIPKAKYCTVYAKPMGRPMVDLYVTEVSQDTWIYFPWDLDRKYSAPLRS